MDFHAATGPGGGAAALQVDQGDEKSMTFKTLVPGLYVYCRVLPYSCREDERIDPAEGSSHRAPARARFRTADKIALRDNTDQFPRLVDHREPTQWFSSMTLAASTAESAAPTVITFLVII